MKTVRKNIRTLFVLLVVLFPFAAFAHGGEEAVETPSTLITLLAIHVGMGLVGVMALYAVWMGLLKKMPHARFLSWTAVTAAVSLVASWITGGYYYVVHYGNAVKPIIKAGENAWAHSILMETKEHVFLFLPILAIVLAAALFMDGTGLAERPALRRALALLAATATVIGIFIALAGILISGSGR